MACSMPCQGGGFVVAILVEFHATIPQWHQPLKINVLSGWCHHKQVLLTGSACGLKKRGVSRWQAVSAGRSRQG
jgi:hypothetical protein